jgi:hypothetical protein
MILYPKCTARAINSGVIRIPPLELKGPPEMRVDLHRFSSPREPAIYQPRLYVLFEQHYRQKIRRTSDLALLCPGQGRNFVIGSITPRINYCCGEPVQK